VSNTRFPIADVFAIFSHWCLSILVGFSVCYPYLNNSVVGLVEGRPLPVLYNAVGRPMKSNYFSTTITSIGMI